MCFLSLAKLVVSLKGNNPYIWVIEYKASTEIGIGELFLKHGNVGEFHATGLLQKKLEFDLWRLLIYKIEDVISLVQLLISTDAI